MEKQVPRRTKHATSIRLTDDARRLLETISKRQGISQAAVVELAVRDYAEKLGVTLPEQP